MKKKQICWQKYEDYLEKQMSSPMLEMLKQSLLQEAYPNEEELTEEELSPYVDQESQDQNNTKIFTPIPQNLIEDIALLSSFDCWIGHTNFDITHSVKNKLDVVEGVEILKIMSRYRFFIGLGTLFKFNDVRKNVEEVIIPK
jgi:hypothetical protein